VSAIDRSGDPLLTVTGLKKHFPITKGVVFKRQIGAVKAVDGLDLKVYPGETIGLVGESGCGKSTAGRTMTKLLEPTDGSITFDGRDITKLSKRDLVPLRKQMAMIFQDPYSSLNPRHTVGTIVGAPFKVQGVEPPGGVKAAVQDIMARVGLNPEHYNRYPNEFSGGQRQRIGIARAVALQPKLIVCDEPVSALDVSVQAQVVNLLEDLQDEFKIAFVFVAHDLSVIRHISDRVVVMYLGRIMEVADRDDLYGHPVHPYTHALLSAVPIPDPDLEDQRERIILQGDLPSPSNPPSGCVFRTRCYKAQDVCATDTPVLRSIGAPGHQVACHFPEERAAVIGAGPAHVDEPSSRDFAEG
jgi:oligopeptide/dipeptide ABC transporter ATP-binding protein